MLYFISFKVKLGLPSAVITVNYNCLQVSVIFNFNIIIEPRHEISNNVVCATSKGSDQPAHMRSLIRPFASEAPQGGGGGLCSQDP